MPRRGPIPECAASHSGQSPHARTLALPRETRCSLICRSIAAPAFRKLATIVIMPKTLPVVPSARRAYSLGERRSARLALPGVNAPTRCVRMTLGRVRDRAPRDSNARRGDRRAPSDSSRQKAASAGLAVLTWRGAARVDRDLLVPKTLTVVLIGRQTRHALCEVLGPR